MNIHPVVSQIVGEDLSAAGLDFVALKLTSTGVKRVTAVTDRVIGTLVRGNVAPANGQTIPTNFQPACDLLLTVANGLAFVQLGAGIQTAITMGDELQLDTTSGCYCKKTAGPARAIAWDSCPENMPGAQIRAVMLPEPSIALNAPTQTQTALTDNSTGAVSTTLAAVVDAVAASTDTTAASLTSTNAALHVLKNAVASMAAELALVKADVAALIAAINA